MLIVLSATLIFASLVEGSMRLTGTAKLKCQLKVTASLAKAASTKPCKIREWQQRSTMLSL